MRQVTCNNCGWVHVALPKSNNTPTTCFRCGEHYKNFREAKEGDAPRGCTLQSIQDWAEVDHQLGLSF